MNVSKSIRIVVGIGTAFAVSLFAAKLLLRSRNRKKITRLIDTLEEFRKHTVQIKDKEVVEDKVCQLIKGGAHKLQVIMDFDNTITRHHYNGQNCPTSFSILDQSPMLSKESVAKGKELYEKYYPIEIDHNRTLQEKLPHMIEWYEQSFDVITKCGVKKTDFSKMVEMSSAMLRIGCQNLFETLNEHQIPLLIFSAGLGDMVEEVLKHFNCVYPNMKFVSNYLDFDKDGKIIGLKNDLIHSFNKDKSSLENSEYFSRLKAKTNILLVGDSLGDLDMACGVSEMDTILKIGFLNSKIQENLAKYLDNFDIVLVDDQSMDLINSLLHKIL